VPSLCGFYPDICLITEEKARENLKKHGKSFRVRNVSDRFVEKVKTHFTFSNVFPENLAFYEITWKKHGRGGHATGDKMAHGHCMLDN
jgi:hypothetical protein